MKSFVSGSPFALFYRADAWVESLNNTSGYAPAGRRYFGRGFNTAST
jgi:hypothetical protein